MTIEVALFGAGRIGKIHAANLARQPGVRLRYVVDVNEQAAIELAARHGARVARVDDAIADPAIAVTVVCSSTDTHADLILKSADARKHVFCEKPVDLALERARQCAKAVSAAGVVGMIGFQRRFDPTFSAVKRRIDAGEIGSPEMLIVTSRDPGAPPLDYIRHSGGIFKDMLIHDFDIFRWILDDEAETVHATGSCLADRRIADAGDVDSTAVTIRTRKGRLCQINTARRAAYGYDQRFEVLGSDGMLQAGNLRPTEVTVYAKDAVSTDLPEAFFLERYRQAYALEIEHFFAAIREGESVRTTVADGVKALELAEAATVSAREGRVVRVDELSV
ncbi:inositol 2-dehydrogenase [Burkholderia sp. AU33545]|uniref:inositol 2-dehydrogenase n=1 Tax=Burkholderia sp. AU33545 TaxID=2879631 RepID=UPI001CF594D4|nr:inositol 2-dehydrogenase [Burkholderia sp. AU33545]MCA8205117.1 inositol 2-dehydrogenase [Burkholderia sp. AU33545]